jgi:hypothetical protein
MCSFNTALCTGTGGAYKLMVHDKQELTPWCTKTVGEERRDVQRILYKRKTRRRRGESDAIVGICQHYAR